MKLLPTPETDALLKSCKTQDIIDHARNLERQRDEAREKLHAATSPAIAGVLQSMSQNLEVLDRVKSQRDELLAIAQEFCDRVDRGEIRSVKTYARFKAAIAAVKGGKL